MGIVYTPFGSEIIRPEVFLYFTAFFITFSALFLGFHALLAAAIAAESLRCARSRGGGERPTVSVVIPAKDEAARMGPLLDSLLAQDYPDFEVLFVEDRSTDDTAAALERFVQAFPGGRARLLRLAENPGPNYKQYALARGIEQARGEILLFTDADCEFGPSWISSMVDALGGDAGRGRTGLAIGPVFRRGADGSVFGSFQSFDHAVRFMYLTGTVGLGLPCGGFGNNLVVSRRALDAIGGYDAVPFSVTEDAALIAEVRKRTDFRVRAALGAPSRVLTASERSWRDLVRQGLRWNNGGLFAPDLATRLGFGSLMFSIAFGVVALVLVPFFPAAALATGAVYLSMALNTACTAALAGRTLGRSPVALIRNWLLTPAYFSFLTVLGLLGVKVVWKGERIS